MSSQGSLYLGYNLVLLVQPLEISKNRRVQLSRKLTERAVRAHSWLHLRSRFCKEERRNKNTLALIERIERVVQDRLQIVLLSNSKIPILFKGKTQSCVYVLIDTTAAVKINEASDQIRSQDPRSHIEQFYIECPPEKHIRDLEKRLKSGESVSLFSLQEEGVYHLASRICAAFVEYRSPWPTVPIAHKNPWAARRSTIQTNVSPSDFQPISLDHFHATTQVGPTVKYLAHKIMDIRDAVDLVCGCLDGHMRYFPPVPEQLRNVFEGIERGSPVWARYKFPFGVWFRGSSRVCFDLQPSLFRYTEPKKLHPGCMKRSHEQVVMFDECSMVHHFREHLPDLKAKYGAMFDWLCLMQHHGAPSRLLDWTENILYALYFAVRDRNIDCDGVVWVLNAGRLNEITRVSTTHRYICFPSSADVHLRTAMAISHNGPELRRNLLKLNLLEVVLDSLSQEDGAQMGRLMSTNEEKMRTPSGKRSRPLSLQEKLSCPVAVFPGRGNERLAAQLGTFTLHGGKLYDPELRRNFKPNVFAKPYSLMALNREVVQKKVKGKQFLDAFIVPSGSKRKIREQLKRLGVHAAAVFPELDYQSEYMKREWMISRKETSAIDID